MRKASFGSKVAALLVATATSVQIVSVTPAIALTGYHYNTIGIANKGGFLALGARDDFFVSGNTPMQVTSGAARVIETTWFAMSDGGDSLIEVFAGVSSVGEWGLTSTNPKLIVWVYYPGTGTAFWNFGNIVPELYHSVRVQRLTATSWRVYYDGYSLWTVYNLGGGYISDVATGEEFYGYSEPNGVQMLAVTGHNPGYMSVFGVWVNGYPGGWAVQSQTGSPHFGSWYLGLWVNGSN